MTISNEYHAKPTNIDAGLLVLRVGVGSALMLIHGWQKLTNTAAFLIAGRSWGFVDFVHRLGFPFPALFATCAALGESICALSVLCGLFTRPASLAAALTMLVAMYGSVESGTPVEAAYLYALPFVTLALTGAGEFSFDRLIRESAALRYLHALSR